MKIILNFLIFCSFLPSIKAVNRPTPVVSVVYLGLLGNRFFAYCVGKIVAEKLGFKLRAEAIFGFPNTYSDIQNVPSQKYRTQFIKAGHDIDIDAITKDRSLRNITLYGFFQRYAYLKPYRDKIRNDWLKIDPKSIPVQNPNDVVIHIRTTNGPVFLPFDYYKKALASMTYNRVYICIDEPNHPFLENFKPYNPIVRSSRSLQEQLQSGVSLNEIAQVNLDDFLFMLSFNKIIISHSTYAWWAGFLSNAQEVYAPYNSNMDHFIYGIVEEPRYHYIQTHIGNSPTL